MTAAFWSQPTTVADLTSTGVAIGALARVVTLTPAFAQTDLVALSRYFPDAALLE
ncbi:MULTISPECIES: hypothetical protein [Rhizobium]|uniref:Glucoamylase n=1 Tax=Rhizobium esperanzae TaxID=1967781 RepID=A0A7W6XYZ2_9HYPH|nr:MULTISPECIES: hypothetical protein [Rhizobium]MBB4343193.1 glucoamylase [Rhizobium leguminosarum]MBB4441485.1 glucoamylase [Rhizobium esperanzae]MBB5261055.1 glucoamylase [Rhizobium leguminosarum]MBB6296271.1 glucoamylase [Rhizobium leguminosarum]MBX5159707.1 hypothetical protein [Rhizobium sp. NZLR8]